MSDFDDISALTKLVNRISVLSDKIIGISISHSHLSSLKSLDRLFLSGSISFLHILAMKGKPVNPYCEIFSHEILGGDNTLELIWCKPALHISSFQYAAPDSQILPFPSIKIISQTTGTEKASDIQTEISDTNKPSVLKFAYNGGSEAMSDQQLTPGHDNFLHTQFPNKSTSSLISNSPSRPLTPNTLKQVRKIGIQQTIRHRRDMSLNFGSGHFTTRPRAKSESSAATSSRLLRNGIMILVAIWTIAFVVMAHIFGFIHPATTFTTYEQYEDDTGFPIPGYYFYMTILSTVVIWIWCICSWVGMKFFRHSKGGAAIAQS